jgi:hypothetical protein
MAKRATAGEFLIPAKDDPAKVDIELNSPRDVEVQIHGINRKPEFLTKKWFDKKINPIISVGNRPPYFSVKPFFCLNESDHPDASLRSPEF